MTRSVHWLGQASYSTVWVYDAIYYQQETYR